MATQTEADVGQKGGKFLTFNLAKETYGLEILKVREIIGLMDITAVPRTPGYVKGVINLRGKVIPVIDLRLKFKMPEAEHTDETCIIVVNVGNVEVGILVDKVSEVIEIQGQNIEDAPSFGSEVDTNFILGMGKTNDTVTILLDIAEVLKHEDVLTVRTAMSGQQGSSAEPAPQAAAGVVETV